MTTKKILFKSILSAIAFFGTGYIIYFAVNAALPTSNTGDKLTSSKRNNLVNEVNSLRTDLTALNSVPVGSIVAFNSSSCPTGWIPANGSNGTVDLRGEFIRGLDSGKGVDSGRTLGSWQAPSLITASIGPDVIQDLVVEGATNRATEAEFNSAMQTDSISNANYGSNLKGHIYSQSIAAYNGNSSSITVNNDANRPINNNSAFRAGGSRPRNVALLYCVKQ